MEGGSREPKRAFSAQRPTEGSRFVVEGGAKTVQERERLQALREQGTYIPELEAETVERGQESQEEISSEEPATGEDIKEIWRTESLELKDQKKPSEEKEKSWEEMERLALSQALAREGRSTREPKTWMEALNRHGPFADRAAAARWLEKRYDFRIYNPEQLKLLKDTSIDRCFASFEVEDLSEFQKIAVQNFNALFIDLIRAEEMKRRKPRELEQRLKDLDELGPDIQEQLRDYQRAPERHPAVRTLIAAGLVEIDRALENMRLIREMRSPSIYASVERWALQKKLEANKRQIKFIFVELANWHDKLQKEQYQPPETLARPRPENISEYFASVIQGSMRKSA